MKKKICYVGSPPLFTKGASAIHIMKMCQALAGSGFDVDLILPGYDKKENIFEYYGVEENFNIISIPHTQYFATQIVHGIASSLYLLFNKEKYYIVLTRNIVFTYLATRFFNIRTIYDAHHPPVNGIALQMFKSFKNSKNLVKFSTNSKGLADIYLKHGLDKQKLVVAHNGVELDSYKDINSKTEYRNQLGLPADRKIVCYSGNTYKGRGIENLIEVASKMDEVLFVIIGGLEEDNNYYRNIVSDKNLSNVQINGFVPHSTVPDYLISSDVLVIPYTKEMTIKGDTKAMSFTSPIKLFEYMAACRPIVATSIPSVLEILVNNQNSIVVEPDNVDSLHSVISIALEDDMLSEKISSNARDEVREYTWEKRVERILENV